MASVGQTRDSLPQAILQQPNRPVLMAQVEEPPPNTAAGDPLIDHTGEDAIYLALLIILVLGALIIGAVSRHLQAAILFSLFVSAALIVVMIAV